MLNESLIFVTESSLKTQSSLTEIPPLPATIWQNILLNYLTPAQAASLITVNHCFYQLLADKNLKTALLGKKINQGLQQFFSGVHNQFYLFSASERPELYASGYNAYGQLGAGDTTNKNRLTPCPIPPELRVIEDISIGSHHTIIWGHDPQQKPLLYAAGFNQYGQLATGDNSDKHSFTRCLLPADLVVIEGFKVGKYHTIVYGRNPQQKLLVYSAGFNKYYQLATGGDNSNKNLFTRCPLPEELTEIENIQALENHTIIYGRDPKKKPVVYAAGYNSNGRLATGSNSNKKSFTLCPIPEELTQVENIHALEHHTIIYGRDQHQKPLMYAAGFNIDGRLATGDFLNKNCFTPCPLPEELTVIEGIMAENQHVLIYGRDRQQKPVVYIAGKKSYDPATDISTYTISFTFCPLPKELTKLEGIAVGSGHTIIYGHGSKQEPLVFASGDNSDGRLATGDTVYKNQFTPCPLPKELKVIDNIKAQTTYTLIYGQDAQQKPLVYAAGFNSDGRLAIGHYSNTNCFTPCLPPKKKKGEEYALKTSEASSPSRGASLPSTAFFKAAPTPEIDLLPPTGNSKP